MIDIIYNMIEVKDLVKKFRNKTVLEDINLQVKQGEIFGYLGPNGAGKTTTMRVILGLLNATSGSAFVLGKELIHDKDIRKRVGVLLEHDGLYNRISAYENLNYYAQLYDVPERQTKIQSLLELSGLYERRNDKVGEFSKGMKRKLALSRALIHQPEVLFLDEPSAGLDPEAQKMVRDLLLTLSAEKKITIFLNSHDLDEVQRICTNIAIIQRGRIRVNDTLDNLRSSSAAQQSIQIALDDDESARQAAGLLSSLRHVSGVNIRDASIVATVDKGIKPSDIITYLVQHNIEVEEVKKMSKSLEDIYLEVVHQEEK